MPWRRERLLTLVFWPGEFRGLYSPWGHQESDMTEWLSLSNMQKWRENCIQKPFLRSLLEVKLHLRWDVWGTSRKEFKYWVCLIGALRLKTTWVENRSTCIHAKLLCNIMDCSPPGSSVRGILQARILEWVAIPFSRRSSWPRDPTSISYAFCIGRRVLYH